jgi:hypothetical protein
MGRSTDIAAFSAFANRLEMSAFAKLTRVHQRQGVVLLSM